MHVGCTDCGKPLNNKNRTLRPMNTKKGCKDFINCCKDCQEIWSKKTKEEQCLT